MRRRCENRPVQQVFPVAGKFPDRGNLGLQRLGTAAGAGEDDRFTDAEFIGPADPHRRQIDRFQRLDHPETGFLIIARDMTGNSAPRGIDHPYGCRLDDKIADGQHESAVGNDDTVALPVSAQRTGGKAVFRNFRVHRNDGRQNQIQVEGNVGRSGPELGRDFGGLFIHRKY